MSALDLGAIEARMQVVDATIAMAPILGKKDVDAAFKALATAGARSAADVPALVARVRELEAAIERVENIEPTWYRGMYGSPDDMISRISLRRALEAGERA